MFLNDLNNFQTPIGPLKFCFLSVTCYSFSIYSSNIGKLSNLTEQAKENLPIIMIFLRIFAIKIPCSNYKSIQKTSIHSIDFLPSNIWLLIRKKHFEFSSNIFSAIFLFIILCSINDIKTTGFIFFTYLKLSTIYFQHVQLSITKINLSTHSKSE